MEDLKTKALEAHIGGKFSTSLKMELNTKDDLSLAYTPGVAEPCKEIAKDKLVIMVTHNPDLAKEYSTRIINIKDGKIIGDSNPFTGKEKDKEEILTTAKAYFALG